MFKIGSLVKYDGPAGVPVMARVEGFEGRRVRVIVLPEGVRLTVPPGDIALPGEDEESASRALSAFQWASRGTQAGPAGMYRTYGNGNFVKVPETDAVADNRQLDF
jgi:hypothetical protein